MRQYLLLIVTSANHNCSRAVWDPSVIDPQCIDYNKAAMGYASLNVVTDFATVIIPLPLLWQLNLPRSRKLQLIGIFLTGSLYKGVPLCVVSSQY